MLRCLGSLLKAERMAVTSCWSGWVRSMMGQVLDSSSDGWEDGDGVDVIARNMQIEYGWFGIRIRCKIIVVPDSELWHGNSVQTGYRHGRKAYVT
jgi:hypothetical protein